MLQIQVPNEARSHLDAGDTKMLKKVLEAESERVKHLLVENASSENFRFYQGIAQTLLAVIKLLP